MWLSNYEIRTNWRFWFKLTLKFIRQHLFQIKCGFNFQTILDEIKGYIHTKDNEAEQLMLVTVFIPRPLFSGDIFLTYFCHPSDEILQYRQNYNVLEICTWASRETVDSHLCKQNRKTKAK